MSFPGVIGQERAAAALEAQIARTGGAGSTLILGPEGVGRFLLAHRAARRILADDERSAALVDAFAHPDLLLVEPEGGIDAVRAAAEALQRRPALAARQVLLLRDIDRMHVDALNALLKTLEEPPAGAAILAVATDTALLPETVVSRCRIVRARPLSRDQTREVLRRLGLPEERAVTAEGSPGRALYQEASGAAEHAERLFPMLLRPDPDALALTEALARRAKDEDSRAHRRRVREVLAILAARLREALPQTEAQLRCVLDALGSLEANANPGVVLADVVLTPWKNPPPRS